MSEKDNLTIANARLGRLISSEVCNCNPKNAKSYASELKKLAASVSNDDAQLRARERLFKALGDATRLKILKMLAVKKEMCVCEVMTALDITQPTASHHLGILEREDVVRKKREGKWIIYHLSSPKVIDLIETTPIR
ncbi:MAG: metalloregulator ArsR/SmtB family transcription factor [Thaumarchaeota archaeon]|nr:metalloregulator ArsR/SmtB family transcription factor [Nitrososphaerota archaeon]MCL5317668.1 metalloregulator ArsR/SmtB family transcription factor [Nitrososphaerota archaeon]